MSSTNAAKLAAVRAFFGEELMPLAAKLKGAGRPMFPTGADAAASTYFKTRTNTAMSRADFVVHGTESPEAFVQAMQAYWERSLLPEMAVLAPTMAKLAVQLRGAPEKNDEVSPFMYVMF
jgi:hypothetical protein